MDRSIPDGRVTDREMTMRLSEWRAAAPHKDAAATKVNATVDPILAAFGAGVDPHAWVAWGDEPSVRFTILVPTDPGLIVVFVRVLVPGEGPRASAKLVRWSRVAIGELAVEAQSGHRVLSFQVEQQVLRGVDDEADRVAAFALRVIAALDGRPLPPGEGIAARGDGAARAGRRTGSGAAANARSTAATRGAAPLSARPTAGGAAKTGAAAKGRG